MSLSATRQIKEERVFPKKAITTIKVVCSIDSEAKAGNSAFDPSAPVILSKPKPHRPQTKNLELKIYLKTLRAEEICRNFLYFDSCFFNLNPVGAGISEEFKSEKCILVAL